MSNWDRAVDRAAVIMNWLRSNPDDRRYLLTGLALIATGCFLLGVIILAGL